MAAKKQTRELNLSDLDRRLTNIETGLSAVKEAVQGLRQSNAADEGDDDTRPDLIWDADLGAYVESWPEDEEEKCEEEDESDETEEADDDSSDE